MKYLPLIWATLWRKKTRTMFTLLSIVIAFLLFGVLETIDHAFSHPSGGVTGADKLVTTNKYSITLPLPFADAQQIRSVPGVAEVTWISWFGGYYQEPKNFVFALPVDTDSYFNLHKGEFVVSDEQMQAYRNTRTGAIVEFGTAEEIRLEGRRQDAAAFDHLDAERTTARSTGLSTSSAAFRRQGSDPGRRSGDDACLFHYELFDEGRSFGKGTGRLVRGTRRRSAQSAAISNRIDALFANSPNETKTQPANDFTMAFIKQLGDIGFVLRAILGRRVFHPAVPDRQHHDAIGARAHSRACRAEDPGLRRRQGAAAWCWPNPCCCA